ncbi:hypothetical protein D1AOALGA4SA_10015 [Olavius algarvensis Delta 1 endosymbiont]|nr:hypothetical protein D1AOALGA4SA_10015 [Olavius algarvensis Delta 1 endosymbiont]
MFLRHVIRNRHCRLVALAFGVVTAGCAINQASAACAGITLCC